LHNRCAHRGMMPCQAPRGHVRRFVCPYHGWAYDTDGRLMGVPSPDGYEDAYQPVRRGAGLAAVPRSASYRGFVFASLAADGPDLATFLGPAAAAIDNLIDRAPNGTITLSGGGFRQDYAGNWKFHMENSNDLVHPGFVHESSIQSGEAAVTAPGEIDTATDQALAMFAANGLPLERMDESGTRGFPNGHSYIGGFYESGIIAAEPDTPAFAEYKAALATRLGGERTDEVLGWDIYNHLIYPNLVINPRFQSMRVVEPVAVDRTIAHSYCFRLDGAPEDIYHCAVRFLTTLNSPASLIATDDLAVYEAMQIALSGETPDWVDTARRLGRDSPLDTGGHAGAGTSELPIRAQYQAWLEHMTGAP
jgi:phenylpropionate dioxygenase-like ring-hydroxylating dioxygenase large terminal subunit